MNEWPESSSSKAVNAVSWDERCVSIIHAEQKQCALSTSWPMADPKWCSGGVQGPEKAVLLFSPILLDKHRWKIFAVSFMLSMVPFSHWNPCVIWRNKGCFSCVNIPVRMDSEPVGCKPRNLHPPTCHHIRDKLCANTKWLIWNEGTTHVPQWAVSVRRYLRSLCSTWPYSHLTTASFSSYPNVVWNVLLSNILHKHRKRCSSVENRYHYCVHAHLSR